MLAVGMWAGRSKGAGAKIVLERCLGGMGKEVELRSVVAAVATAVEAQEGGEERSRLFGGMLSMGRHPPVG